jgi:hypothetical protein
MVNNEALDRLDDWVPYLGLEKLRKTSEGYVAVAHWRPSNRGRPLAERSPNLGISFRGIVDFGDGNKGYRPFDLVMAALRLDYWWQAYRWLDEQLHGPYPIIGDLTKAQQARMKTTMETADPVVDRTLNLAEEQDWALDEEHSGQGNENENMTSETETIEPLPRSDAPASDILELVKIGNWRKLNRAQFRNDVSYPQQGS